MLRAVTTLRIAQWHTVRGEDLANTETGLNEFRQANQSGTLTTRFTRVLMSRPE